MVWKRVTEVFAHISSSMHILIFWFLQMVNRSGLTVDSSFPDSQPTIGNKRSVRDRLGSNVDLSLQVNKRMRGDGSSANAVDKIWKGVKCQIQGSRPTIRDFRKLIFMFSRILLNPKGTRR
ncbi:uncharacterized protein LOC111381768 isoform X2 [Olea europaea var. sylvestris]|uniref:uncharacterized protein LOC111381768 isoform X2 n=1 Tax=Olea europaea var. sylvestris TaxID=158386 RepID=UPI000C1D2BB6|nr:uncharacterized protein LOC111381768 isoform X2 [Olea europaea var. sylvestris]